MSGRSVAPPLCDVAAGRRRGCFGGGTERGRLKATGSAMSRTLAVSPYPYTSSDPMLRKAVEDRSVRGRNNWRGERRGAPQRPGWGMGGKLSEPLVVKLRAATSTVSWVNSVRLEDHGTLFGCVGEWIIAAPPEDLPPSSSLPPHLPPNGRENSPIYAIFLCNIP